MWALACTYIGFASFSSVGWLASFTSTQKVRSSFISDFITKHSENVLLVIFH